MYFAKETLSRHAGLGKTMQTSLREIKQKAKKDKTYRFRNLYRLINSELLKLSWKNINKSASAGTDKVTAKVFKENLDNNINEIVNELRGKRYHAKLVRRVYIPKGKDKIRPLGIPAMKDKLVQSATAKILESIYEQDFSKCSYGYRPKVSASTAIKSITDELNFGKYSYIVEADIKGFFNNINHEWLMKMLKLRIQDNAIINLINKWLKAGILDVDGKIILLPRELRKEEL
jgi:group II intron reverse transcriptase/maturase